MIFDSDEDRSSLLHIATRRLDVDMCRILLEKGIDVNSMDQVRID
jgi:hypothetical protein